MVEFRTLGTLDLRSADGRELTSILAHPKRTALLAYLAAATPRGFHRRDALLSLFWSELDQEHARASLRKAVYYLRRTLGEGVLVGRGDEELGLDSPPFWSDVAAFEEALDARDYGRALELYRGPFLEAFFAPDAPEFERWLERERARLHERAFRAAWALAEQQEQEGDAFGAAYWGRQAAALAPADEAALRRLLSLLERLGDRAGAVRAYEEFARHLAADYDVEPSAETQALVQSIRSAQVIPESTLPADAPANPAVTPSLGEGSVAVLPFTNLSPDPDNEYFSDGMTEELISALARIEGLRVAARTSAFAFKGKDTDIREIGRRLGVTHIVEGSVRKSNDRLKITAQLIQASGGYYLWSEVYEKGVEHAFAIQEEIARAIVDTLRVRLIDGAREPLVPTQTKDPEAYSLYLRGRYLWNKRTEEALEQSLGYFQQAVDRDPAYALAYVGLSDARTVLGCMVHLPQVEVFVQARAHAEKALELDPDLAEAHASLAHVRMHLLDWAGAERAFRRAVELKPSYAFAHHWHGMMLNMLGQTDTALSEVRRAQELDPLSLAINHGLGVALIYARDYDAAVAQLQRARDMEPRHHLVLFNLAWAYTLRGDYRAALDTLQTATERAPEERKPVCAAIAAYIRARAGDREHALVILDRVKESATGEAAFQIGATYAALGKKDPAFEWLEHAYEEDPESLQWIRVNPILDPLRSDPRFQDLLQRLHLS